MRILYIAHETNLGGATRSLIAILEYMRSKGHTVIVVVPKYSGKFRDWLIENGISTIEGSYYPWQYNPRRIHTLKAKVKKLVTKITAIQISNEIKDYKIDVIHTNSSTVDLGLLLAKRLKIKHVYQFREFGFEDQGVVFRDGLDESLKMISRFSDIALFISKNLQKKYYEKISCEQRVIYNGISRDYLIRKEHHENQIKKFMMAGSIVPKKGQWQAVEAARILFDSGVTNFTLSFYGAGDEAHILELRNSIVSFGLSDIVFIEGAVSNIQERRKEYDIELVCSESEAFGRVTIEAMMASNPVIASNAGANPELVIPGFNGYLYESGNSEDLARKMKSFLLNSEEIDVMGRNAYEYAITNFTAEKNAKAIEALYLELIGE